MRQEIAIQEIRDAIAHEMRIVRKGRDNERKALRSSDETSSRGERYLVYCEGSIDSLHDLAMKLGLLGKKTRS